MLIGDFGKQPKEWLCPSQEPASNSEAELQSHSLTCGEGRRDRQFELLQPKTRWGSVQFSHSVASDSLRWTVARQAFLSFTNFQSWLKLMSVESVMPFNHLVLCCPPFSAFSLSQH